jgi:hypothetical protein
VSRPASAPLIGTVAVVNGLYYVLLSQVLFIGFLLYNYVLFFETDKIVGGTIGIVSALLAIVGVIAKLVPAGSSKLFVSYIFFLCRNLLRWIFVTSFLWLAVVAWSYRMSNDVFGRILYVKYIHDALDRGSFDLVSLPDANVLASAFSMFPNRREIPFLLTRSSRLLFLANRTDIFRSFQKSFLSHLDTDRILTDLCNGEQAPRHDGLTFLLSVAGEAYSSKAGLQGDEHQKDIASVLEKMAKYVRPVEQCRKGSLEAQFQLIKFKKFMDEISEQNRYDVKVALASFDRALASAEQGAVLKFWQSHAAQEYLDFQSYNLISNLNQSGDPASKDNAENTIKSAMLNFEKLLLLRQGALRSGDVAWEASPFKLNIFYAFMLEANLHVLVWDDVVPLFRSHPLVVKATQELTDRKVFDEFRQPKGWYAGTPLDFGLNGSGLNDKINAWLKTEW